MFSLNDKVVYPGHGVASICRVFERHVGQQIIVFYELKFQSKDMTIMVPKDKLQEVGVRHLSSHASINDMLENVGMPARHLKTTEPNTNNWNKRNKDYQTKLRTGSLESILEIYKDLKCVSFYKQLSFGEKSLLLKTEALLVEEISAVQNIDAQKAMEQLRSSVFIVPTTMNAAVKTAY